MNDKLYALKIDVGSIERKVDKETMQLHNEQNVMFYAKIADLAYLQKVDISITLYIDRHLGTHKAIFAKIKCPKKTFVQAQAIYNDHFCTTLL